jgi:S1-C subfamily serine protease
MPRNWNPPLIALAVGTLCLGLSASPGIAADDPPKPRQTKKAAEVEAGILGMSLTTTGRGRVVISEVSPESPAATAGLRKNDEIVGFDNHRVKSLKELTEFAGTLVERKQPGDEVEVLAIRDDKEQPFVIILPERADPIPTEPETGTPAAIAEDAEEVFCMLLRESAGGKVIVVEVSPRSPAAVAGILPGDQIVTVGEVKILSIDDLRQTLDVYVAGDVVPFGIERDRQPIVADVTMAPCRFVRGDAAGCPDAAALAVEVQQLKLQIAEIEKVLAAIVRRLELAPAAGE